MLASAAVSLLSLVTHQATRHGRPGFHPYNSGTPLTAITQRDPRASHPAPRSIRIVAFCETATVLQGNGIPFLLLLLPLELQDCVLM